MNAKACVTLDQKTVLNIELYGHEFMAYKGNIDIVEATNATSLRLTEPWKGTGRRVVGESWFGYMKSPGMFINIRHHCAFQENPKSFL